MKQIAALLKQTWWLWLLLIALCIVLTIYVDPVGGIICFPLLLFVMLYFAFVRFDEDGNPRGTG
jgi:hypothetical protein